MLLGLLSLVVTAGGVPEACAPPPTRDVGGLTVFAQRSGALSVGLDSVATWCFDGEGGWTGGVAPPKPGAKQPPPKGTGPAGDCARAIAACQKARTELGPELRALVYDAIADLDRPYLSARYTPRRTGLSERPSEIAECESHTRADLFTQAQARMDLARLASQAQNEYANYRTWLFSEGLKCADLVAKQTKDPTRNSVSLDSASSVDAGSMRVALPAQPPGPASTVLVEKSPSPQGSPSTVVIERQQPAGSDASRPVQGSAAQPTPANGGGTLTTAQAQQPPHPVSGQATGGDASRPVQGSGAQPAPVSGAGTLATAQGQQPPRGAVQTQAPVGLARPPAAPDSTATGPASARPVGVSRSDTAGGNGPTRTEGGTLGAPAGPTPEGSMAARERALSSTLIEKWRYFAAERAKLDFDPDWATGFLASRELRDCKCVRQHPADLVRRLEAKDNVAQLEADDAKNTRCELCLDDVFPVWKSRMKKQCALMDQLSDYELGVLSRSDDGNGLPPRCFAAVRARRGPSEQPQATASAPAAPGNGSGFIITKVPEAPAPAPTTPTPAAGNATGSFVKAGDYAPVPEREDGRMYVRVFMSSACVADLEPGPMQARTGDLLPVPMNAKSLTVRSPCGGMAEVYWGKEEKPRVSETFGKGQPLQLQFAR